MYIYTYICCCSGRVVHTWLPFGRPQSCSGSGVHVPPAHFLPYLWGAAPPTGGSAARIQNMAWARKVPGSGNKAHTSY